MKKQGKINYISSCTDCNKIYDRKNNTGTKSSAGKRGSVFKLNTMESITKIIKIIMENMKNIAGTLCQCFIPRSYKGVQSEPSVRNKGQAPER